MKIINKNYLPMQKLPSVRELSFEFEVNPNTIQKALFELEDLGLIYTDRTNGKFITNNEKLIEKIKNQTIQKIINNFFDDMKNVGVQKDQVIQVINDMRGNK